MKLSRTFMNKLFLAWQEPESRRWYPIGCLEFDGKEYHFFYNQSATNADPISAAM
jgi:hypothetical protein